MYDSCFFLQTIFKIRIIYENLVYIYLNKFLNLASFIFFTFEKIVFCKTNIYNVIKILINYIFNFTSLT